MTKEAIVAGTGFEGRAEVIRRHVRSGMLVQLRREPSNPHDPNAVAVLVEVPRLFGLLGRGLAEIGYLKSGAATNIAAKIDSGIEVTGRITSFYAPVGKDHPRVSLRLEWSDA